MLDMYGIVGGYIRNQALHLIYQCKSMRDLDCRLYEAGYIEEGEETDLITLLNDKGETTKIDAFEYIIQPYDIYDSMLSLVILIGELNGLDYDMAPDDTPVIIADFVDDITDLYSEYYKKVSSSLNDWGEVFDDIIFECLEVLARACSEISYDDVDEKVRPRTIVEDGVEYKDYPEELDTSEKRLQFEQDIEREIFKPFIDRYKMILHNFRGDTSIWGINQ